MSDIYDVIIIGGGPGGYNCAIRCGQLGLKVACVETRKALGGTCLNVGCIPSKSLLHATELFETAEDEFEAMGMSAKVSADVPKMIEKKQEVVDGLTKGIEFLFKKKNKVDRIEG
ncbi:MAG: FAD-dependent oxidoreductase, partial [Pseudomonadota bacterium]